MPKAAIRRVSLAHKQHIDKSQGQNGTEAYTNTHTDTQKCRLLRCGPSYSRSHPNFPPTPIPPHTPRQPAILLGSVPQLHDRIVRRRQQSTTTHPFTPTAPAVDKAHRGHPALMRLEVHEGALVLLSVLSFGFLVPFQLLGSVRGRPRVFCCCGQEAGQEAEVAGEVVVERKRVQSWGQRAQRQQTACRNENALCSNAGSEYATSRNRTRGWLLVLGRPKDPGCLGNNIARSSTCSTPHDSTVARRKFALRNVSLLPCVQK